MSQTNIPMAKGKLIEQVRLHDHHDPHRHESRLADVILGGQDGLVNVLGVILGVAAATQDARIVIAAGMAATFAESISMGAVAYTSKLAEHDLYHSEREREHRHIHLPRRWRSRRSATFMPKRASKGKRSTRSW